MISNSPVNDMRQQPKLSVAVIGTGFSGICASIRLKQTMGVQADIFEISKEVGGTWYHNTFPGAECDIPSHLYSLSFELNPNWPKHYSAQSEIQAYMKGVAKKHDLYKAIKFESEVVFLEWHDEKKQWKLQWRKSYTDGPVQTAYYDVVFAGLGPLRIPNIPKEFSAFEGPIVHTAEWDHSLDYANKRIAIVGAGATAIQVIPEIRKIASHVYSYQRTPAWTSPRDQFSYPKLVKLIFKWFPFLMRIYRCLIFLQHEALFINFGYYGSFLQRRVHATFKTITEWRLKRAGRPDLIEVLTPKYSPGCKRIAKSELYLEALAQKNVTVIPSGIAEIKGRTLVDHRGGEYEVDILILATGYEVLNVTGNLQIRGQNNVLLKDKWTKEFPATYKTVTTNGFPNFFNLLGPASGLGHNSVVTMIEIQVEYAIKALKQMQKLNAAAIEPKKSAEDAFVAKLQKDLSTTVWKSGCDSWYLNEKGEVFGLWSGTITSFWWQMRKPNMSDFILHRRLTSSA